MKAPFLFVRLVGWVTQPTRHFFSLTLLDGPFDDLGPDMHVIFVRLPCEKRRALPCTPFLDQPSGRFLDLTGQQAAAIREKSLPDEKPSRSR